MAGRSKENFPGGSLKYLFVYLKIRICKCSYRIYICAIIPLKTLTFTWRLTFGFSLKWRFLIVLRVGIEAVIRV